MIIFNLYLSFLEVLIIVIDIIDDERKMLFRQNYANTNSRQFFDLPLVDDRILVLPIKF